MERTVYKRNGRRGEGITEKRKMETTIQNFRLHLKVPNCLVECRSPKIPNSKARSALGNQSGKTKIPKNVSPGYACHPGIKLVGSFISLLGVVSTPSLSRG